MFGPLKSPLRNESSGLCVLLVICSMLIAGCQGRRLYNASSLPIELTATREPSLRQLDLSRLSRSAGVTDVIYPGDQVRVRIATGIEKEQPQEWDLRVAENGVVDVPLVGPVAIAGLELVFAEQALRAASIERGKFVNPAVSIGLQQRRSNRVTIVGAVQKPGTYEIPVNQCDVLTALVQAGGLSEDAGTLIEIQNPPRQNPQIAQASYPGQPRIIPAETFQIDLVAATANPGADLRVHDGSTIMVTPRPERYVHVMGLVNQPDQFELPDDQDLRLLDALAMAGGRRLELADKVHVIRKVPGQDDPVIIQASVRKAKSDGESNIRLAAGDVISVEETATTFVVGTIRDFVRFGFSSAIPGF